MRKFIQVAGLLIALPLLMAAWGCEKNRLTGGAETPAQTVFALKERYKVALALADQYEDLRRCKPADAKGTVCSDPGVVDILRKADTVVDAALDQAETVVRDPAASESLLKAALNNASGAVSKFAGVVADLVIK